MSVLTYVFAWFIVPLIAVGRFYFSLRMYWTLQNLEDSENKQQILHYGSVFSAAAVSRHNKGFMTLHD
jgi:dihydroneopterin aldolase